jgi:hypothetical protein
LVGDRIGPSHRCFVPQISRGWLCSANSEPTPRRLALKKKLASTLSLAQSPDNKDDGFAKRSFESEKLRRSGLLPRTPAPIWLCFAEFTFLTTLPACFESLNSVRHIPQAPDNKGDGLCKKGATNPKRYIDVVCSPETQARSGFVSRIPLLGQ